NSVKPLCIIEKEERKVNYFSAETQKSGYCSEGGEDNTVVQYVENEIDLLGEQMRNHKENWLWGIKPALQKTVDSPQ
ncbi:MAG: hypothetical protein J5747_01110, partial [Spirochaetaceae bacterium]|nr:hypothetical protein [Spirochaetaceae bacterium]